MGLIHNDKLFFNKLIRTLEYQQLQQNTENHTYANMTVGKETLGNNANY